MIELKNVSKHYKQHNEVFNALTSINLQVKSGDIVGIIGRSGAGKSTLVKLINQLELPSSGEIWIGGINFTALSPEALRRERRQLAMIFQHFNLLESRSVFNNIALPLEIIHANRPKIKYTVNKLLEIVGLSDKAHHYPSTLSGGQKQRVAIARALTCQPKVLLCDEATSALDPESTQLILELLKQINTEFGLTIIMVTHEMNVIKNCCDRAAILDQGQIVEENTVLEIFSRPQHTATYSLTQPMLYQQLPKQITQRLTDHYTVGAHPLIRLTFIGQDVEMPLLAMLSESLGVETNIVAANIDWIQNVAVGITFCELLGDDTANQRAFAFIKEKNIQMEVLGYVHGII